jgi:quercetin dioxygenase-like cupin family protein
MLTRRSFGACAICASAGLVVTSVDAQPIGQPQTEGGVTRTILGRTDLDAKYVVVQILVEIPANMTQARHTHPGIETGYVLEGGLAEWSVEGQPNVGPLKVGEGFQIRAGTPHGGKNGPRPTKAVITLVVEKDKPLVSPA